MTWMQTHKGRFDFAEPGKHWMDIESIAHSLSLICRFNGHCKEFYSVAQHSVYVSQLCKPDNRLSGLLHDAPEAYIGDMVSPLKKMIPAFQAFEGDVWEVLARQQGLPLALPQDVKDADLEMLALEARDLMGVDPTAWGLKAPSVNAKITPWDSKRAERHFLDAYRAILGEYPRALAATSFGGVY